MKPQQAEAWPLLQLSRGTQGRKLRLSALALQQHDGDEATAVSGYLW